MSLYLQIKLILFFILFGFFIFIYNKIILYIIKIYLKNNIILNIIHFTSFIPLILIYRILINKISEGLISYYLILFLIFSTYLSYKLFDTKLNKYLYNIKIILNKIPYKELLPLPFLFNNKKRNRK